MITGNEPLHSIALQNGLTHDSHTEAGITLKQHMVIEFTKACLDMSVEAAVKRAIMAANEVIKQLNDEDK